MAAITQEVAKKNKKICRYKAEQTVVLNRVRDLFKNPGDIVSKAYLYDKLMETGGHSLARQTLQIMI